MKRKINYFSKKTKNSIKEYFSKIIEIIKKPEMGILPGQLAFFTLLSMVPIITLCGYAAGLFNINIDTIIDFLNNFIPGGADFLIPYVSGNSIDITLAILFIYMFYLASNGCNSIILISNQIYGIPQSNFFKRRIKAIFMTFAIVVLFLFLLVVPVFGHKLLILFDGIGFSDTLHKIYRILKGPLTWLIMFVFIRSFYEIAPDRVRRNSHINTGAIFTSIGWIIVTNLYEILANNMTTYNIVYGALSSIAFLVIWLYFMSFIFVIGLSLNYGAEVDKETMDKTGAVKIIKNR